MSNFPPFSIRTHTNASVQQCPGPSIPWHEPRKTENVLRHKYGRIHNARAGDEEFDTTARPQDSPCRYEIQILDNMDIRCHEFRRDLLSYPPNTGRACEVAPSVAEQVGSDRKRPLNTNVANSVNATASTAEDQDMQGPGRKRRRTLDSFVPSADVLGVNTTLPKADSHRLSFQGTRATSDNEIATKQTTFVRSNPATPTMRPANVHASAALFRRSSSSAKKQTRPPMSKLFTSLELSPEEFLDLQAAAKAFMLDSLHPERRDCIGSKGAGDGDRARLRLHSCVREFLNEYQGTGERFFGHDSPSGASRRYVWPTNELEVIDICIPLLRRMVTNERQRQYAFESRQSTGRKRLSGGEETGRMGSTINETKESTLLNDTTHLCDTKEEVTLRLVIIQVRNDATSIISRSSHALSLLSKPSPSTRMNDLVQFTCAQLGTWPKTREVMTDSTKKRTTLSLKALSPRNGVQDIRSEEDLDTLIDDVRRNIWMEGELRVVAEAF